jgi:hypothetical protein
VGQDGRQPPLDVTGHRRLLRRRPDRRTRRTADRRNGKGRGTACRARAIEC